MANPTDASPGGPGPRRWTRHLLWWPCLIGPAVAALVVASGIKDEMGLVKPVSEEISPWLLGVVTGAYALRAWRTRSELCMILTCLAAAFVCREIHFAGTSAGVKVAAGALLVWTVARRKHLTEAFRDRVHIAWVAASAGTYILSVLVAKNVFRGDRIGIIPDEAHVGVSIEEGLELTAHVLFLASALLGGWRIPARRDAAKADQTDFDTPPPAPPGGSPS